MPQHSIAACRILFLGTLALAAGCSQSTPPQTAESRPEPSETVGGATPEPQAVDDQVRPATAESRIESVAEPSAKLPDPADPAAPTIPARSRLN